MANTEKKFSLDKPTVLLVLYDALDMLGVSLEHSDSVRGVFRVAASSPPVEGEITVTPSLNGRETTVEVISDPGGPKNAEWTSALFDEMESLIRTTGLSSVIHPQSVFHKEAI